MPSTSNPKGNQATPSDICLFLIRFQIESKVSFSFVFSFVKCNPLIQAHSSAHSSRRFVNIRTEFRTGGIIWVIFDLRFKREDSSLSTCSSSTANSARSVTQAARCAKLQERLRTFEVQIRERDQIISRLKMDKAAVSSRCQVLMDAYKQLRRVSVQSIPSQKLPKDISQEIMRMLSVSLNNTNAFSTIFKWMLLV